MTSDYLKLCRVSNLPTVWTNVLAAVVLSGTDASAMQAAVPAVSMSLFYSGGMCMNDVVDSSSDLIKKPLRPIPSGRVSRLSAAFFSVLLFLAGLLILALSPYPMAFYLGTVLLGLIVSYNLLHNTYRESIVLMAGCRFMIFAGTAAAVQGVVADLVLAAGIAQFLYTLGISYTARREKARQTPFSFPVLPFMIAGFSVVDGLTMTLAAGPRWFLAGITGALLTLFAQLFARGD